MTSSLNPHLFNGRGQNIPRQASYQASTPPSRDAEEAFAKTVVDLSDTLLGSTRYTDQRGPLRELAQLVRCETPWQAHLARLGVAELLATPDIHRILDARTLESLRILNAEDRSCQPLPPHYMTRDPRAVAHEELPAYAEASHIPTGRVPRQSRVQALAAVLGRGDARDRVLRLRAWIRANPGELSADTFKAVVRNINSASYQVTAVKAMVPKLPAISAAEAAEALKAIDKDTYRVGARERLEPSLAELSANDALRILQAMDSDAFRIAALDVLAPKLGALSDGAAQAVSEFFWMPSHRFDAQLVLRGARLR